MIVLLILLLLVGIVTYTQRHRIPQAVNLGVFVLLALVSVTLLVRSFTRGPRSPDPDELISSLETFDRASSYRLGQAVAQDIPEGSEILVIHRGAYNPVAQRLLDGKLDALRLGLAAPYSIHLAGLPEDPARQFVDETDTPRSGARLVYELLEEEEELHLSGAQLGQFLAQHPSVEAVVSFIGPPHFHRAVPRGMPPLYVMGGEDDDLSRELLQRGVVRACVTYRTAGVDWLAQPSRGMSLDDIFNLRCELLRAAH